MAKTSKQQDNLNKALGVFIEAFRPYVVALLISEYGESDWEAAFLSKLTNEQQRDWERGVNQGTAPENLIDYRHLKNFAVQNKDLLKGDFKRDINKLPTWLEEITDVRNKVSHYQDIDDAESRRAIENMLLIARAINMTELEAEIKRLSQTAPDAESNKKKSPADLSPWFSIVRPHLDIRQGQLDESVFAANLAEVALGTGREVYQNASLFFEKTFPTQGLRAVARRVIKGLNGEEDSENRVISLQTGFGGGKTHILISLYHLAKTGSKGIASNLIKDLLESTAIPKFESANVAVFTNTTNDPAQGRTATDGTHIRTIWGELAYQLGGTKSKETYELIRANDETRTSPAGTFKKVLEQCKPALILIDELADYCVKASAQTIGSSNLSDQTISFIQELSEAVAASSNCVLVATLPASATEVASSPQAAQILNTLQNRLSRVSADTKPVADEEIYEVIRRRLFEDLGDEETINGVLNSYNTLYQELRTELPSYAIRSDYKQKLKKSYPFHPELIDVFKVRWASNHDFQRTRGVLRLLASIVSDLWRRKDNLRGKNLLIHTGDVYFENLDALTGQLKKLYGNGYDAVISADVSGPSSNANKIDDEKPEYGNWSLTKGVASTILLNSFGIDTPNKGSTVADIKLAVMKPQAFNHNSVNGALDELEGKAYYLHYSSAGTSAKHYWFHTKPNINILINQAKNDVQPTLIDIEIERRLKERTRGISLFNVLVNPGDEVPEQQHPTLIILGPRYSANPSSLNGNTKPIIERIATKKGNSDRKYRNTILFLICSEQAVGKLQNDVREYLACQRIRQDYATQLEAEQRQEVQKRMEDAGRQCEGALAVAYSIVAKYRASGIEKIVLNQGEFKDTIDAQINSNIIARLKSEEWLLEGVGIGLLRSHNLLPTLEEPIRVTDVYEAFIRFDDKPMITSPNAVKTSLERYCTNGEFAIAAGDGKEFTRIFYKQPVPYFEIADANYWLVDKTLYKPEGTTDKPEGGSTVTEGPVGGGETGGKPVTETPGTKTLRKITVSGNVPLDQYTQIFNSFIMPLAQNNIEIQIKISGKSTSSKPITESSQEYKIVKESARQLGLDFNEEK